MINKLSPFIILVALMASGCAANSPVSAESTLAPFEKPVKSVGTLSVESPTVDLTDTESQAEVLPQASPVVEISFINDVLPILQSRCIVCHGKERREQGLELTSYSTLMAGSDYGPVIVAGNADDSLIVELVLADKMPKRAPKLIPVQAQTLIDWINQGAMDN